MSFVWLWRGRDLSIQLLSVDNYSLLRQSKARIESNLGHGPECCVAVEVHDVAPTLRHARHSQHNTLQRVVLRTVSTESLEVLAKALSNFITFKRCQSTRTSLFGRFPTKQTSEHPSLFFAPLLPNLIQLIRYFYIRYKDIKDNKFRHAMLPSSDHVNCQIWRWEHSIRK